MSQKIESSLNNGPGSANTRRDGAEGRLPSAPHDVSVQRETVRIEFSTRVLIEKEVESAAQLFASTAGWASYAESFREDALRAMGSPQSAVIGTFLPEGTLIAVGCAIKEAFDFAYWSITWVMVDEALRNRGVGADLIRELEAHMLREQDRFNNPNCRVLLSAIDNDAARFYEKLGYRTLLTGPLDGECFMYKDVRGPGLPLKLKME